MLWQAVNQILWHLYVICIYALVVTVFDDWEAVKYEVVNLVDFFRILAAIARGNLPLG